VRRNNKNHLENLFFLKRLFSSKKFDPEYNTSMETYFLTKIVTIGALIVAVALYYYLYEC